MFLLDMRPIILGVLLCVAFPRVGITQITGSAAIGLPLSADVRESNGVFYLFTVGTELHACSCDVNAEWQNATVPTSSGGRSLGLSGKLYRKAEVIRPYLVLGAAVYGLGHRTYYGVNGGLGAAWIRGAAGIYTEARLHSRRDMSVVLLGVRFN